MTDPQPKRPVPPEGCASWLDYLLQLSRPPVLLQSQWTATVAELAELRQALADAKCAIDDLREVLMCPACDYDPPTHRCGRCDSEVSYGD